MAEQHPATAQEKDHQPPPARSWWLDAPREGFTAAALEHAPKTQAPRFYFQRPGANEPGVGD